MIRYRRFNISRERIVLLLSTSAAFAFVIWFLNENLQVRNFWSAYDAHSDIDTFFCEETLMDRLVRQPVNTFSNFIYWMTGLAVLSRGWKDQRAQKHYNLISANPFYSIVFGCILIYTFAASTVFHASLISFAGRIDYSAVFFMCLFPLMYFSHRLILMYLGVPSNQRHPKSTRALILFFSALYVLLTFFLSPAVSRFVVLGIIVLLLLFGFVVERIDSGRTNHYYLVYCSVFLVLAVLCYAFDVYKILCNPMSLLQPHSLWHVCNGLAAFYFYMYIRSEKHLT